MKKCARCGIYKDEEEFNWRWKALGRRQSICRDCQKLSRREHYQRHQSEEIARVHASTKRRREEAERFIYEYLSVHPCVDCGEYDYS
ncbi:MAG: hypothetical protein ACM3PY_13115, partial [Omnitrophica WOR_2 bacterium]